VSQEPAKAIVDEVNIINKAANELWSPMEKVENMAPIGIINAKKFMANEDPMMTEIVNGEEQKRKNEKLI